MSDLDALRYPVGKFDAKAEITRESRARDIAAIASLPGDLRAAVDGLTDAQIDTPYRPEGWTVRQLVHHVADSHLNAYCRVRLALTEDAPTIKPYDEQAWANLEDARTLPVDISLGILDGVHFRWRVLLQSLDDAQRAREVTHPEHGRRMSVDFLTAMYGWHCRHHLRHITALREREGW